MFNRFLAASTFCVLLAGAAPLARAQDALPTATNTIIAGATQTSAPHRKSGGRVGPFDPASIQSFS